MSDSQQRLFLILPPKPDILEALSGLLPDPRIASALIAATPSCPLPDAKTLQSLVSTLQKHDIAVLLEEIDAAVATTADGVQAAIGPNHDMSALDAAIKSMKPHGITGAGNIHSRHDAMIAGEKDIDYILFGGPAKNGKSLDTPAITEKASWWNEIFTIPCIAHANDKEAFAAVASTGSDFVSICPADTANSADAKIYVEFALSNLQAST